MQTNKFKNIKELKLQEYFLILLAISWGVFSLLYMPKSNLFFLAILIGLHALTYIFWVNGYIHLLLGATFILLIIIRFLVFGFSNYDLVFLVIASIFLFLFIRFFVSFIEEMIRDSESIRNYWETKLRSICVYKYTTTLLTAIILYAFYLFGDNILTDPVLYELWVALVVYAAIGFLTIQALNLIAIIKADSISHKWWILFCLLGSMGFALLFLYLWWNIACTAPGLTPPNLPGVGAYQEMVLGFRAPTTEQLLVGKIHVSMHGGEIPPLKEGTCEVDFRKTLPLIEPTNDVELLYRNFMVKTILETFPFTKKIVWEILNGIGPYDIDKIENGFTGDPQISKKK